MNLDGRFVLANLLEVSEKVAVREVRKVEEMGVEEMAVEEMEVEKMEVEEMVVDMVMVKKVAEEKVKVEVEVTKEVKVVVIVELVLATKPKRMHHMHRNPPWFSLSIIEIRTRDYMRVIVYPCIRSHQDPKRIHTNCEQSNILQSLSSLYHGSPLERLHG